MKGERLAVDGGTPVKTSTFGSGNRFGAEELEQLSEALSQGTVIGIMSRGGTRGGRNDPFARQRVLFGRSLEDTVCAIGNLARHYAK